MSEHLSDTKKVLKLFGLQMVADQTEHITFEEICRHEPRVAELAKDAQAVRDNLKSDTFCANSIWYNGMRARLIALVGHNAHNPILRNSEAYDIAYDTIYGLLPDCRNCCCC